jgi:carboxymethylenebutenolidase
MHENDPIGGLIHLYEDGALNRRELITRLTRYTGSAAAAVAAIESAGFAEAQTITGCPAGIQVAENDPAIVNNMLTIHGEGGPLYIYQSLPRDYASSPRPAVLVVHENRGLNEHIKDVTRRVAKSGYIAIGVDLLSRQGGTERFPDAQDAGAAYNRTVPAERRQDLLSALLTIRDQRYVTRDRIGAIGFCAGGGNVFDLAVNTDLLSAAVVFYGTPPPSDQIANLTAPVLGIYGELDRGFTGQLPALLTAFNTHQKPYELHIYQDARHAFHNDTSPSYNAGAACDAWERTLAFFTRHLNRAAVPPTASARSGTQSRVAPSTSGI